MSSRDLRKRLRSIKHRSGVGVWDESRVKEKRWVSDDANRRGVKFIRANCGTAKSHEFNATKVEDRSTLAVFL